MKIYNIEPVPKPRMTNRDRKPYPPKNYKGEWPRPPVKKYINFANQVKAARVELPEDGAHVIFRLPMPPSWSKKKKKEMCGRLHKQTPDLDNLIKALGDAVYGNDSVISDIRATKIWSYEGKIQIFDKMCFF